MTPYYDLFPARVFATDDLEETGLTINGKKRQLSRDDIDGLAAFCGQTTASVTVFLKKIREAREPLIAILLKNGASRNRINSLLVNAKVIFDRLLL